VTRSLRRTLAVRFAATMAVGLIAAAVLAYWATWRVIEQQLDHSLASAAFLISQQLSGDSLTPLMAADPDHYERDVNRYIALRDGAGRLLVAVPVDAHDLPYDGAALSEARGGHEAWAQTRWHERTLRAVYEPVVRNGTPAGLVLEVAASLRPFETVRRDLIVALIIVVFTGTGATLLGAWQLAGSAVEPVTAITDQATRIEAGTLDQRIAAHADTEEYEGLVAVLNRMLERLERQFVAQRRLTADLSHELRTPLTALRGEIEVAQRAERTPREYQKVMRSALEEIERLTTMSEDMLLITRADSRLVTAHPRPTDLNALVERVLEGFQDRVVEKELTVEGPGPCDASRASIDPGLVATLVQHLMDNAVKFTPAGGKIIVATTPHEGGIRLSVEDSGPGIAPEDLPHIFEPFYRADPARTRGTGTGLGLALVAAVARLHGGTVRASNHNGSGARIEVDLPAVTPS
jgi:two-component system, OmpR family, sensor kinase